MAGWRLAIEGNDGHAHGPYAGISDFGHIGFRPSQSLFGPPTHTTASLE